MTTRWSAIPLLLQALLAAGCASTTERQEREQPRLIEREAAVLSTRPDADSIAAAGLLLLRIKPQPALAMLAHATVVAPERTDLLWLLARACEDTQTCDPAPAESLLRKQDPANGASWMRDLARADAADDEAARRAALGAIAHAQRIDIYWTTLAARLASAAARDGKLPLTTALTAVLGQLAATTIPPYAPVSNACKGERLNGDDIIEMCRAVAATLVAGDAYITETFGIALTKRLWPADSDQWRAADAARRRYQHVSDTLRDVDQMRSAETAAQFLSLLEQHRREQDVMAAELAAAH